MKLFAYIAFILSLCFGIIELYRPVPNIPQFQQYRTIMLFCCIVVAFVSFIIIISFRG